MTLHPLPRTDNAPTVVSLFSGGGGLDLGFDAAGFDARFQTDIDPYSCTTLQWGRAAATGRSHQFFQDAVVECGDLRHMPSNRILMSARLKVGEPCVLIGGPPCQAFSVFGKRKGRRDPRALLVNEYLRVLGDLRPEAFVFENVYGLLSIEGGAVFEEACAALARPRPGLRYELSIHRLEAAEYGVPQYRDRIFIVGHRGGRALRKVEPVTWPAGTIGLFDSRARARTVADGLRGLPPIGATYPRNHVGRVHSQPIIERYRALSPGERDSRTRINKLALDRPSFTIIVGSDKGGGKGHVHPIEPREVTPRESARMQTFPDWWAFAGTSRHPIRQVGNAVPPLLGAAVANAVREQLFDLAPIPFADVLSRLGQEHLFVEELRAASLDTGATAKHGS